MTRTKECIERFMAKIEPEPNSGCWLWSGTTSGRGYGGFRDGTRMTTSHRFSYLVFVGEIPTGMYVCHKCDTPLCVNPDHLFVGTNSDNQLDSVNKSRHHNASRTECPRGHDLSLARVDMSKGRPRRFCRECNRLAASASKRRKQSEMSGRVTP